MLRELYATQLYAVLGTLGPQGVNLNLMAFAATDDLSGLIIATDRATAKYTELRAHPPVALLIDSRANQRDDTRTAMALTVKGLAEEATGSTREALAERLLARHPQLASFVRAPTCALFHVRVLTYQLVRGIDDVRVVRLDGA
jgi:hypothetical protein